MAPEILQCNKYDAKVRRVGECREKIQVERVGGRRQSAQQGRQWNVRGTDVFDVHGRRGRRVAEVLEQR
jgi:hypothetical protein